MKHLYSSVFLLLSYFGMSQTIGITTFATGFSSPVEITHPTNDTRLFVVQQTGAIRILNADGTINPTNFLTLTSSTISNGGERGLLGLAFHPNYATNGYFYVNYTNTAGNTVIARYSVSTANSNIANPTGTILLTISQPYANHNGGTLKFGPDGYLYIGMGDGGSGGDPENRAQNINENLGKMLRIDVDSGSPYSNPSTNPYVGIAGNDEIWAIGLRNPWKFSFNRLTGDLWIADVGQNQYEEINKLSSPVAAGLNFGWKCYEANSVYTAGCAVPTTTYTFPVAEYSHAGGACSITGGYVYTGSTYPNFTGLYFFADYCLNRIGTVNSTNAISYSDDFDGNNNFTTFGEDSSGELYIASGAGTVYKIIDTSLGTSAFNENRFNLYPNPAVSEVFVKANPMYFPAKITIFDSAGKRLVTQDLDAATTAIATDKLQKGFYLVTLMTDSGLQYNTKLLIK